MMELWCVCGTYTLNLKVLGEVSTVLQGEFGVCIMFLAKGSHPNTSIHT